MNTTSKYRWFSVQGRSLLVALALATAGFLTFPPGSVAPRWDDWDWLRDLNSMTFLSYVLKPGRGWQFVPVHKALYAAVRLTNYSNWPLLLATFFLRLASIGIWLAILRQLRCWSF